MEVLKFGYENKDVTERSGTGVSEDNIGMPFKRHKKEFYAVAKTPHLNLSKTHALIVVNSCVTHVDRQKSAHIHIICTLVYSKNLLFPLPSDVSSK